MSQENVETIARLYDEFLAKPERVASPEQLAFFDPAVVVHQSESLLGSKGIFNGYDGVGRAAREVFEVFSEAHWVPKRLVDSGDQVVATVEFRGIGKEGGVRIAKDRRPRVDAQRRTDHRLARLPGPGRSSRSGGAVGVGDVAGDRRRASTGAVLPDALRLKQSEGAGVWAPERG